MNLSSALLVFKALQENYKTYVVIHNFLHNGYKIVIKNFNFSRKIKPRFILHFR